jgi:hypothetical protein
MFAARRCRLEGLERRQPRGRPYVGPLDLCVRLWEAFKAECSATKKFCRVPRREPVEPISDEDRAAFELAMREYDGMHARPTADKPV